MTTLFPILSAYELPVWPSNDNYSYDLWSLFNDYPIELPLLSDIDLPDNNELYGNTDNDLTHVMDPSPLHGVPVSESNPLDSEPTTESSHLYNMLTPEPSPLHRMPTPEPSSVHRMPTPEHSLSTPEPSPLHSITTSEPSPLQRMPTPEPSQLHSIPTTESSLLHRIPTPEPSPLHSKLTYVANHLHSTTSQESNQMYSTSTTASSPLHNVPAPAPEASPLQSTLAHSQMTKLKLEANQEKGNLSGSFGMVILNSTRDEGPMDFEDNETLFPKSVKKEEQQQNCTVSETAMESEVKTEQGEQLSNDAEELSNNDRPPRSCNSRYSLRVRGSLHRQSRPTVRKTVVLWKFIKELLDKNDTCVSWISREERSFKFVDSKQAAKLWGLRKNKRNMTYEKMSRALRYYYDRQIMYHEEGQKLMYRFGDGAREEREQSKVDES